jgi:spore coat polysaccharide biosynthesis predicted glycosyltransferase SpsG
MFAICIESSHERGMGHFFRMMNFIGLLNEKNEKYVVLINNNQVSIDILNEKKIISEIVDYQDFDSDWETRLIKKYKFSYWINDRLDTNVKHSLNVVKNGIKLITFDDRGSGSEITDINFFGLAFEGLNELKGKKVLTGLKYLVLNKEIEKYRKIRKSINKIVVTLGGSDTYGVTLKAVKILKKINKSATVIIGPLFEHVHELEKLTNERFQIKSNCNSLIEEFSNYDLAITGGGITPFEANASGLPCIIIANEIFEIPNARYLEKSGSSVFAGYHTEINELIFSEKYSIEKMSKSGIKNIKLNGLENIYGEIKKL